MPPFEKFIRNPWVGRLITFDPGETTGYSIWDNSKLTECGQLNTFQVQASVNTMATWLDQKTDNKYNPEIRAIQDSYKLYPVYVVIEEYRVYSHMTQQHAQDDMHTSRLIGCLETLLTLKGIRYEMRGAGLAKQWATDEKLKAWNMWQPGKRHARDAIRHGIYFFHHGKTPQ